MTVDAPGAALDRGHHTQPRARSTCAPIRSISTRQLARADFAASCPTGEREIERLIRARAAGRGVDGRRCRRPPTTAPPHLRHAAARARSGRLPARRLGRARLRRARQPLQAVGFTLSDLVLVSRDGARQPARVARWSRARTGRAARRASRSSLYRYTGAAAPERIATGRTDAAGRAEFAATGRRAPAAPTSLLVARRGDDVALSTQRLWRVERAAPAESRPGTLRLHRPRDLPPAAEALWKVLAYDAAAPTRGDSTLARRTRRSTVSLRRPQRRDGGRVDRSTTNEFGTAAGEFAIPAGRLLGSWTLATTLDGAALDRGRGVQAADLRGRRSPSAERRSCVSTGRPRSPARRATTSACR